MKVKTYYTKEGVEEIIGEVHVSGFAGILSLLSFWTISIITYAFTFLILCLVLIFILCISPFILLIGIIVGLKMLYDFLFVAPPNIRRLK